MSVFDNINEILTAEFFESFKQFICEDILFNDEYQDNFADVDMLLHKLYDTIKECMNIDDINSNALYITIENIIRANSYYDDEDNKYYMLSTVRPTQILTTNEVYMLFIKTLVIIENTMMNTQINIMFGFNIDNIEPSRYEANDGWDYEYIHHINTNMFSVFDINNNCIIYDLPEVLKTYVVSDQRIINNNNYNILNNLFSFRTDRFLNIDNNNNN